MSAIRPEPKTAPLRPREEDRPTLLPPVDEPPPLSVVAIFNVMLRRRRLALAPAFVVLVWMLGVWAWDKLRGSGPVTYTATTTFDLESGSSNDLPANSLASQLGLVRAQSGPPPYERLLRSRALLIPISQTFFVVRDSTGERRGRIAELFGLTARTAEQRQEKALNAIRGSIKVGSDRVGTPALMVTTPWPSLSVQLADSLTYRLNEFNTARQQSKVGRERRFTEARLEEKRVELRAAESRMQTFLEANRDYRNSPMLTFQFDRLNRELQLKQSLFNTLATAVETARIDEVRNAPIISVIEPAYVPPELDEPQSWLPSVPVKGIVRIVLALFLGIFLAFAGEFYERNRDQSPEDVAEFRTLARDALAELRRPWRMFSGLFQRRARRRPDVG
jgi:uncharacterized protein involved in exopolysaccharide biosynthesis